MYILMNDIIEFLGDAVRPLKAGLDLYKSQHVVHAGRSNVKNDVMDLVGQVLQTSDPRDAPHNVKICDIKPNNVQNWNATCSCKAGLGHKCKHIFALLLYIVNSKENLEILSQTDVEQQWGVTARERSIQPFDAKLITELCCVSKIEPVRKLSKEITQSNFRRLMAAVPKSAVSLHFNRQRVLTDVDEDDLYERSLLNDLHKCDEILDDLFNLTPLERNLQPRILPHMQKHLKEFYFKKIYCDVLMVKEINRKSIGQRNNVWKLERRKRITASDAYRLFTYSKNKNPDWPKKISDYVNPKNFQTPAMQFGSSTENEAILIYNQVFKCEMSRLGFVISPIIPWLGCSVDGFIPHLRKTIKFKCPVLGASKSIKEVLPTLKYLDKDLKLKVNHTYYCQVQLGMAVLNATCCDFVVYCKNKKQLHVIPIPFDPIIVGQYVTVLSKVFFKYILPFLYDV